MQKDIKDLKVLIDNKKLIERIKTLADEINNSYKENETIYAVCILKGAVMFYTHLVKYLKMPLKMEFISLSSYKNSFSSTGEIQHGTIKTNFENKDVLIIEDIMDTGLTLDFLVKHLKENSNAKSVKTAVLFNKKCARKHDIQPDFYAFDIDDKFIVGFGLDYLELYRNIDYIGYFE